MSLRTLPLIYYNLGGEMVYIIEQRLSAQQVAQEQADKVLGDLVSLMLHPRITDEIFLPQPLHGKASLRAIFENIAHASSMRLNQASMDKLFDLMLMSSKWQMHACRVPRELIGLTLNHLDGFRHMLRGTNPAHMQVSIALQRVVKTYASMSPIKLALLRQHLLLFYQDSTMLVAKLINSDDQLQPCGHFRIWVDAPLGFGVKAPVKVALYTRGEIRKTAELGNIDATSYEETFHEGSLEPSLQGKATRGTQLGLNIFKSTNSGAASSLELRAGAGSAVGYRRQVASYASGKLTGSELERQELNLLRTVLQSRSGMPKPKSNFNVSLFDSNREEQKFVSDAEKLAQTQGYRPFGKLQPLKPVAKPQGGVPRRGSKTKLPAVNKKKPPVGQLL